MTEEELPYFVTVEQIDDLVTYERRRPEVRARMIKERELRRISAGPFITFSFENPDTVRYQVQEMVRAERIVDEEAIRQEIKVYADLLPSAYELSAVMMIALTSDEALRAWLPKLIGVESSVVLIVDGEIVPGKGEEGRSTDRTTSAVHYLRFPLTPAQRERIEASAPCALRVAHKHYDHEIEIASETVAAFARDLASVTRA